MLKEYPTLLAIHPMPHLGERLLSGRWQNFLHDLRLLLRSNGIEAQDSTKALLLFNFDHPFTAISAFFENLEHLKKEYGWEKTKGALPLQAVFHFEKSGEVPPPFRVASSRIWEMLLHEAPYVSRSLKVQWEQLMAGKKIPAHEFEGDESGLFLVKFAQAAEMKKERLFPHRMLIAKSGQKECFYCGMTSHKPAACPGKLLTMETRAVLDVGYRSFSEISGRFKEAFSDSKKLEDILAPGASLAQIRQDPLLQVFIAYFDLFLVYQPRYLWYIAFSLHPAWDGTGRLERVKVDSRNIQTGLDCLRVGEYTQAYELLITENQLMGGKQFYATIGLAFVALERDRKDETAHYLEIANGLASTEKEKIYISLLLSRFHDLSGNSWKSDHALQAVYNLYVDCHEVMYRKVQMLVRNGQGTQALKLLGKLAGSERQYFMAALLDPILLPIQGLVEDILVSHFKAEQEKAKEYLTLAKGEYESLRAWFDYEDADLLMNLKVLANLEDQFKRRSYYDCLDVAERAKALIQACPRLQEAKLDELNERVDEVVLKWEKYNAFWKSYTYKTFFKQFSGLLAMCRRKLVEARSMAAENLAKANARLESARRDIAELTPVAGRMHKVRIALDTLKVFTKKLLITEVILSSLLLLLYPLVTVLLVNQISADFVGLVKSGQFQKNTMFVTNLMIAPVLAFAQTVRKIAE